MLVSEDRNEKQQATLLVFPCKLNCNCTIESSQAMQCACVHGANMYCTHIHVSLTHITVNWYEITSVSIFDSKCCSCLFFISKRTVTSIGQPFGLGNEPTTFLPWTKVVFSVVIIRHGQFFIFTWDCMKMENCHIHTLPIWVCQHASCNRACTKTSYYYTC